MSQNVRMEYNKIIAVTGLPGLYELLSSKSDGAIVRSLEDKSTRFVSSRIHNFSHLESIEVYTVRDNVNLVDILKAMEASPEKLPDDKDNKALKSYFGKVYPDLDFDRVYSSDLKKMVKWFSVLKANDIEVKLTEPEEEPGQEPAEVAETQTAAPEEDKPKAKTAPKTKTEPAPAAKKKTEAPAKEAKTEKPAKASDAGRAKEKATAKKSAALKNKGEEKSKKTAAAPAKKGKTTKKEK